MTVVSRSAYTRQRKDGLIGIRRTKVVLQLAIPRGLVAWLPIATLEGSWHVVK